MEDSTTRQLGTARQNLRVLAVGFQDTTNYRTVIPKVATPQFLPLEIVVLTSFSRAAGATHEARFFPYCRLAPSVVPSGICRLLSVASGLTFRLAIIFRDGALSLS